MSTIDAVIAQNTASYSGDLQVLVTSPTQTAGTFARISIWMDGDYNDAYGGGTYLLAGDGLDGSTVATFNWGNAYCYDLSPSTQYTTTMWGAPGAGNNVTGTILVEQFS